MTDSVIEDAATLTGWRKSSHSGNDAANCLEVLDNWRKSSYSGPDGDNCLEVLDGLPAVPVRDSKHPHGPALVFPAGEWSAFVDAVKRGALPGV
jgi:Domain of unknown function (DUF397)